MHLVTGHDHRAFLAARERRDLTRVVHPLQRVVEMVHLVERGDLHLVGEEHIDLVVDELEELATVSVDAEAVRQRERDAVAGVVGNACRFTEGLAGGSLVPQVPLEVEHLGTRDEVVVDVVRAELGRRAEKRAHGAVGVGGDHHEAASGRRAAGDGEGLELDAGRTDIVTEHPPELVVAHPPDEGCAPAE